jgi:hypothetical protein
MIFDKEQIDQLVNMIKSPDKSDRRLALTIIFENWDDVNKKSRAIDTLSLAYFTLLDLGLTRGKKYNPSLPNLMRITLEEEIDDIKFIKENVCDDNNILNKFFFFNVETI